MRSALAHLQAAIFSCLESNIELMDIVTGIYDEVPQGRVTLNSDFDIDLESDYSLENDTLFPFVVVGDDSARDWSTKTNSGQEIDCTIHTWSRYQGYGELKQINSMVIESISESDLILDGFEVVHRNLDMEQVFRDSDGRTRHGVLRFRFLIQQL